jgi:hypothetical protein
MTTVEPIDGGFQTRQNTTTLRSPRVIAAALLASCSSLALIAFNTDWLLTPELWLDAWHYVGFFREYMNPDYSPEAYKLARLPWILAGYLTHSLLPPLQAAYVLHVVFLCATSLALFYGLYVLLGRVALAGVVATAMGFYTHAHGSGGWDYHNTAAGAFYLLAFTLLALPGATEGRRVVLMFAGAATALAVHTNITLINLVPALAFIYVQTVRARSSPPLLLRTLAARAGWVLLGGIVVTAILGVINWMAGRELLFFAVLVRIASRYVADPSYQAQWHHAWGSGWELAAIYLALPAALVLTGTLGLVLHRRTQARSTDRLARSLIVQFLFAAGLWVAWQTAGQTALDFDYFAYPLPVVCFLALGGLLSLAWPDACERAWLPMILGTIIGSLLCLVVVSDSFVQKILTPVAVPAVVGCALFAAGLLTWVLRPSLSTSIIVIGAFALGNRVVGARSTDYQAADRCKVQPAVYTSVVEGASWLWSIDPTFTRARTWFDQNELIEPIDGCPVRVDYIAGAMSTMAFVPYVTRPWPMPAVDGVPEAALREATTEFRLLTIISNRPEHLEAWRRRLERMGIQYREFARHRVPVLDSGFTMYAWEIMPKAPPGVAFGRSVFSVSEQTQPQAFFYGTPKGKVQVEGSVAVFSPTDDADHIAYPFVTIAAQPETWAELRVEMPPSTVNPASCRLTVQNSGLTDLASFPCGTGTRYFMVPPNTPGLRVYLTDPRIRSFVLPRKIELSLSETSR